MLTLSSGASLFGNTLSGDESGIFVKYDGIEASNEKQSQTVTNRPVEEGYNAFDAIHQNPPILNVELLITDTMQGVYDVGKIGALANIGGFNILNSNVSKQINRLERIYAKKETVSFKTKYRQYNKYYIQDREFTESDDEGVVISLVLIKRRENSDEEQVGNYSNAIGVF